MEFFKNAHIDFLGKKWYFLSFSLIFSVAGICLDDVAGTTFPLGVDFRGGTLVYVKYAHAPHRGGDSFGYRPGGPEERPRADLRRASNNEVLISLDIQETSEQDLSKGKDEIKQALETHVVAGKQDLNNSSSLAIQTYLLDKDPLHLGTDANQRYAAIAQAIVDYRDKTKGGVLGSMDDLKGTVDPAVIASLENGFSLSDFGVRNVEIVGPQVGKQLRKQAIWATLYSLAGMLIYLALRFEWIYGVAAVLTVFHDTLITVGAFSLLNREISLTVIAAILTLIGYSNNDTIVVFDRIRENIKLLRRETLADIVNRSINQTLSRTILTAGLTFLTVLALFFLAVKCCTV